MSLWKKLKSGFLMKETVQNEFNDIKSLQNMPDKYFTKGKIVRVIPCKRYVQAVLKNNGGWIEEINQCLDQVCTVIELDFDKLVRVRTPLNSTLLLHRAVLQSCDVEFENGCMSLFTSIEEGDTDLFNQVFQLEYLNITNKEGRTPINLACYRNKVEITYILSLKSADVTIPDDNNALPIHHSVLNGNMKIFQILANSYPESVYKERRRLLDIATKKDNKMLETLIRKSICKINESEKTDENTTIKKFQSHLEVGLNNRLSITTCTKLGSLSESLLTIKQNDNSKEKKSFILDKYKVENDPHSVTKDILNKNLLNSIEISLYDPPETQTKQFRIPEEVSKYLESEQHSTFSMQLDSVPIDESFISTPLCFKIRTESSWKDILK